MTDDIGAGYDLVIASGILDFTKENVNSLAEKLYRALNPSGYLYLVSHDVSEDFPVAQGIHCRVVVGTTGRTQRFTQQGEH